MKSSNVRITLVHFLFMANFITQSSVCGRESVLLITSIGKHFWYITSINNNFIVLLFRFVMRDNLSF